MSDAAGALTRYAYDAAGRQTLLTDPEGRRTGTVYDLAGQASCTWRGWNSATAPSHCTWNPGSYGGTGPVRYAAYTYTPNGKPQTVADANDNTTEYVYDRHDRPRYTFFPHPTTGARCTAPATETATPAPTCASGQMYEELRYTSNGEPTGTLCSGTGQACRLRRRDGQTLTFGYDAAERRTSKAASGLPTVSFAYNLLNEPTSLTSPVGTVGGVSVPAHATSYAYDAAGRKLSETNDTRQVSYLWDGAGNRTRLTWPDGYSVDYEYDALNRLKYARENGTVELAYYDYDALSQRTLQCLGGQSTACSGGAGTNKVAYGYAPTGRLEALTHTMDGASAALGYDYNAAGQITGIMANEAFYLARPAGTGSSAYAADKLNRYASVGGQAATYNSNGDLLTWYPSGGQHTYTFDVEGRLRSAAVGGSTTPSIFYDYDPQGRRVTKAVGSMRTGYLLDGDEEIAEYAIDAAGVWALSPLRRYIPGAGIDERIAQANNGSVINPPKSYYHTNHQGSVIAMTTAAGTVSEKLAYDAYGNLTSEPPAVSTGQVYRYTGRRFDEETGLYYYRARYYSPLWGRFLQVDPIGHEDDFNLYAYVGNDPLNVLDPFGLCGATATEVTVCASRYSPWWLITWLQELMSFRDLPAPVPGDDSTQTREMPQGEKPEQVCTGTDFDFIQFADQIEENRFDLGATLGTLIATEAVGTMPKTPSELRGLGVAKSELNPITSQLSRWSHWIGWRPLQEFGRTGAGMALSTAATVGVVFEGFYDIGVIGKAAWDAKPRTVCSP